MNTTKFDTIFEEGMTLKDKVILIKNSARSTPKTRFIDYDKTNEDIELLNLFKKVKYDTKDTTAVDDSSDSSDSIYFVTPKKYNKPIKKKLKLSDKLIRLFVCGAVASVVFTGLSNIEFFKDVETTLSNTEKQNIVRAFSTIFNGKTAYSYTTMSNNKIDYILTCNKSGEFFIKVPQYTTTIATDDNSGGYIITDYSNGSDEYYKADYTNTSVNWQRYGENLSSNLSNIKSLYYKDLISETIEITSNGDKDINSSLTDVTLYELKVDSSYFKTLLSGNDLNTVEYFMNEAILSGNKEFAEYNKKKLKEKEYAATYSDGEVIVGLKDNKLCYMSIEVGGGGNIISKEYFFNYLGAEKIEMPRPIVSVNAYSVAEDYFNLEQLKQNNPEL